MKEISTIEQEKMLRQFSINGEIKEIEKILTQAHSDFDINSTDQKGRSSLFLALAQGHAATYPELITLLLANGGVIKNGSIFQPHQIPKLLTVHANALNIKNIFNTCYENLKASLNSSIILEIGSGDGYLKYLLSLIKDPIIAEIKNRIIETELSEKIIHENFIKGKHTIHKGIAELLEYFGESFTPCIISMNVMDTFTRDELKSNMQCIHKLLKKEGIFIHIMSSSIHRNIFIDIQKTYPDNILYPYYKNGYIGLRIVSKDKKNIIPGQNTPDQLCDLYADNPNKFIEYSNNISQLFNTNENNIVLFKDFFIEKIKDAFNKIGFKLTYQKEIDADITVPRNQYHNMIPEANYFENILGSLITNRYDNIQTDKVIEKSKFLVIIGQKCD